jgi:predicted DNA-binding transcriptional regulator AlpA
MSKDSKISELQELPQIGLLRIKQVLKFVPISRSGFLAGVKNGRYPAGSLLSPRVRVWSAESIRAIIEGSNGHE